MITSDEMAVVDANAAALGVSQKQLMESAGNAVARVVRNVVSPPGEVVLVCGRGNNGGDALVSARFLHEYDVTVYLLGRADNIRTDISRENWDALMQSTIAVQEITDSSNLSIGNPDVIVDAILGTGIRGSLREPAASAVELMNKSGATIISVDVPTGIDPDTGSIAERAVRADHVVTFHDTKPGLEQVEATVTVADIGIPRAASQFIERGDVLRLSRNPQAHKGEFGSVLVVGGGPYTGAPALTAQAVLRAGGDLVYVAVPEAITREVQGYSENLISRALPGDHLAPSHVEMLLEYATAVDCVVVGPGLGDASPSIDAVAEFLSKYTGIAVIDADALVTIPEISTDATLICTPHQGELKKMGGTTSADWKERATLVESFADDLGQTVLLKGTYDIISNGDRTRVNRTGNPGMTVGGTGDVLAGVTGAFACVLDPVHAAGLAAYVNGRAGDLLVDQYGYGLLATDLLDTIPSAIWGEHAEQ